MRENGKRKREVIFGMNSNDVFEFYFDFGL
jgi:hypothetical protein